MHSLFQLLFNFTIHKILALFLMHFAIVQYLKALFNCSIFQGTLQMFYIRMHFIGNK